jgi:hypothetical protein
MQTLRNQIIELALEQGETELARYMVSAKYRPSIWLARLNHLKGRTY